MSEPATPPDLDPHDRARIVTLAARNGWTEWGGPPGTLIAVGDAETFYELVLDRGQIAFVVVQRGSRSTRARSASVADAVRLMVLVLGGPMTVTAAIEFSMSSSTFDDSSPVEGDDTGAPTEPEEYGSLTVEDDPGGTIDPAELADTAGESDEDVK